MSQISSELLKKLKKVENNLKLKITSGDVILKTLTLKQQKDLLSTAVTGIKGAIEFKKILNNIILENADTTEISTLDRSKIVLNLRRQSLGSNVSIDGDVCSIDKYIDKIDSVKKTFDMKGNAKEGKIELKFKIPTLKEENSIISKCLAELNKGKDELEPDKAFGLIYIYELIKYIDSVSVSDETALFDDLKITERVDIIENLPLTVYNQLATFFKAFTAYETEILTFDEKTIAIDPAFFDTSN
jgi:transcriptional regulatory protein LevR